MAHTGITCKKIQNSLRKVCLIVLDFEVKRYKQKTKVFLITRLPTFSKFDSCVSFLQKDKKWSWMILLIKLVLHTSNYVTVNI